MIMKRNRNAQIAQIRNEKEKVRYVTVEDIKALYERIRTLTKDVEALKKGEPS